MSEKKPEDKKIVDFTERQREKANADKRKELGVTPDGYLLFPEETVDITSREALDLAREVIEKYGLDTEAERIRRGEMNFGLNRDALDSQRRDARIFSTESLIRIFSFHKKHPRHYARELLLAAAEELVRRLVPDGGNL